MIRAALASIAALALTLPAAAQQIAITGGKVVTNGSQGVIENGTVVIANGRIVSVGANAAPDGVTIVDASGKWVTPGIFAPYTQVGLAELPSEDPTSDTSAGDSDLQASLRVADGFNPDATGIAVSRIDGLTRLALAPSASNGLLAGYGALASTSGGFESVSDREAFMFARLGEAGAGLAGGSRPAAWAWLMAAIGDAKAYPRRYASEKEGDVLDRLDAAAFAPVVSGRVPLMIEAHRASDILQVIALGEQEPQMELILFGGEEAWRVAPQLAAADIPVIVNVTENLPATFEKIGSTMENAARLSVAGVTVAIADPNDASLNSRLIPQHAGVAVANGLDWDTAFAAITRTPADIFGRSDLGRLEPGAIADVVVWDGDPLELMSSPDAVYIDGVETSMESRQTRLRDRYINLDPAGLPPAYRR